MNHSKLELQIAAQNQKEMLEMKTAIGSCIRGLEILDVNMKKSHMALLQDLTNSTLRINFLLEEMKTGKTKEEVESIEEKFKKFAESEQSKLNEKIKEAIKVSKEKTNVVR